MSLIVCHSKTDMTIDFGDGDCPLSDILIPLLALAFAEGILADRGTLVSLFENIQNSPDPVKLVVPAELADKFVFQEKDHDMTIWWAHVTAKRVQTQAGKTGRMQKPAAKTGRGSRRPGAFCANVLIETLTLMACQGLSVSHLGYGPSLC
jgi:hypothetical protein